VVNRVPHFAEAMVEMRSFDPQIFEQGVERMLTLDGGSQISSFDGFPCRVRVELISRNPPWPRNPDTDRLIDLWSDRAQLSELASSPSSAAASVMATCSGTATPHWTVWDHPGITPTAPSAARMAARSRNTCNYHPSYRKP
jgi:hypothetical protein